MDEFEFLDSLRAKYSLDLTGDDCAVLPSGPDKDLLITADLLVEDVDFRLEWTTPEFLGHKALAVSLSDIAAMGGTAKWSTLSIGIPGALWNSGFLDRFYAGWFKLARKYGVELAGGDISRVPGNLVVDSVVGGEVTKGKAILRSTAQPGDAVCVSGDLGGAAGALKLLEMGIRCDDEGDKVRDLLLRQLQPQPELLLAKQLQQLGILTSAIDVSDGLSSDLGHICQASGVGANIYTDRLPIDRNLSDHFPADECLQMALNGGEDFRLLFTVNPRDISQLKDTGAINIGEITEGNGEITLFDGSRSIILEAGGFRHF